MTSADQEVECVTTRTVTRRTWFPSRTHPTSARTSPTTGRVRAVMGGGSSRAPPSVHSRWSQCCCAVGNGRMLRPHGTRDWTRDRLGGELCVCTYTCTYRRGSRVCSGLFCKKIFIVISDCISCPLEVIITSLFRFLSYFWFNTQIQEQRAGPSRSCTEVLIKDHNLLNFIYYKSNPTKSLTLKFKAIKGFQVNTVNPVTRMFFTFNLK